MEAPNHDTSPQAHPLIKKFEARLKASTDKWRQPFMQIAEDRKFLLNHSDDRRIRLVSDAEDPRPKAKQANIVYATLQTLLPRVYAKNPVINSRPAEQAETVSYSYSDIGRFSETLRLVINRQMYDAGLKRVAKQAIRETNSSRVAIVKVSYQMDLYQDPAIQGRLDDVQSSLSKLRAEAQEAEDANDPEAVQAQEAMLINHIKALEKQVEVIRSEGLVIDPIPIDDFRMDTNIDSLYNYVKARWMAHARYLSEQDVRSNYDILDEELKDFTRFERTSKGIDKRMGDDERTRNVQDAASEFRGELIQVWELWDKDTKTFYTWAEGGKTWLKEPAQPDTLGERWYPFFLLGFNWLGTTEEWPLSEVEMLSALGQEYNDIRRQGYQHRKLSAPHYLADKSSIGSKKDVETFSNAALGEVVLINTNGQPIRNVFAPAEPPPYNPQVYDTNPIRADIEWISGVGDAQRGGVIRAKTATEAGIQEHGLDTRTEEKRDEMEDWLDDMAKYAAEVLIQSMSSDMARRIAGPGAFWPLMDRNTLFTMVEVEIEAGSTGKPNKLQEQENWIQIEPRIFQSMITIMNMRAQGIPDKENPVVQLLMETMKRFDERFDLEKFLPGEPQQGQQMMGQPVGDPAMNGTGQPMPQQPMAAAGQPEIPIN